MPYPFGWGAMKPRSNVRKANVGRNAAPNMAKPGTGGNRPGFCSDPPIELVNHDSKK